CTAACLGRSRGSPSIPLERRPRCQRHQPLELPDELVGARVEPDRYLDAHRHEQIPDRLAGQPGQPLAPQAEDLTPRGPRRDHQDRLAGGCRYPDSRAKDCFPYADRHLAVDAVALALEKWMLLNPRADDQVAARAAERSRAPLAGHADLWAGVDAGRDRDPPGFDRSPHAPPV